MPIVTKVRHTDRSGCSVSHNKRECATQKFKCHPSCRSCHVRQMDVPECLRSFHPQQMDVPEYLRSCHVRQMDVPKCLRSFHVRQMHVPERCGSYSRHWLLNAIQPSGERRGGSRVNPPARVACSRRQRRENAVNGSGTPRRQHKHAAPAAQTPQRFGKTNERPTNGRGGFSRPAVRAAERACRSWSC